MPGPTPRTGAEKLAAGVGPGWDGWLGGEPDGMISGFWIIGWRPAHPGGLPTTLPEYPEDACISARRGFLRRGNLRKFFNPR
jgi:hypothetical protein